MTRIAHIAAAAAIALTGATTIALADNAKAPQTVIEKLDTQPTGSIDPCATVGLFNPECGSASETPKSSYPSAPTFPQFGF